MEQEQTAKQVHPETSETIQTEEQDAKQKISSGSRGMDATVHNIDSTRQSVDLASSSKVDDQQASLGSFVHGAQEDDGANQKRQPLFQSYESYRLDSECIQDPSHCPQ